MAEALYISSTSRSSDVFLIETDTDMRAYILLTTQR